MLTRMQLAGQVAGSPAIQGSLKSFPKNADPCMAGVSSMTMGQNLEGWSEGEAKFISF